MKIIFSIGLSILGCCMLSTALAQKPVIDTTAYRTWQSLDWGTKMSPDGNFVIYGIQNKPTGAQTLIIKSLTDNWEKSLAGIKASTAVFTKDSRFVLFMDNPKMGVLNLNTHQIRYINITGTFSVHGQWLTYFLPGSKLVLENLVTGKIHEVEGVKTYLFDKEDKKVILQTAAHQIAETAIMELQTGEYSKISEGIAYLQIVYNLQGSQLALVKANEGENTEVWIYNIKDKKMKLLYRNNPLDTLDIAGVKYFTADGKGLMLDLREKPVEKKQLADPVPLNVWSYKDNRLQSQQQKEAGSTKTLIAYFSLKTNQLHLIRLEDGETELRNHPVLGEIALISKTRQNADPGESNWNTMAKRYWYLQFLESDKVVELKNLEGYAGGSVSFSPDGRFLLYYDQERVGFMSYETGTGKLRIITQGVKTSWHEINKNDLPYTSRQVRGLASWLSSGDEILLYDAYDIWNVDLKAERKPTCITKNMGVENGIRFNVQTTADGLLTTKGRLVLSVFNTNTKENGFYLAQIGGSGNPEKCFMGPYIFDIANNPYLPSDAHFATMGSQNRFLVRRMSEKESPNLFVTSDFGEFKAVSDIHPEKGYNWLNTDLLSWKSLDGRQLKGVLYKPENFDPRKKYPVIFYYYERRSDGLHYFIEPEHLTSSCSINIPTYVSQGYLVFSPDIYYEVGDPMQGTYDAVVSAAKYVAKLPFVDSTKMGIQGCSWGGVQTDYLVTHTNLFSAACSASGVSDFVSTSGGIGQDGKALRSIYETGQSRMKYSLWERPDLYIKNSAIFSVEKVTTPFLLMHTTKDGVCPFGDALEFFTGLRRMGKKAWLLEYEDGNHGVWGKSGVDFSIRMQQFFDHYLKDKPAPIWMTRGISASKKGLETGLELDSEIKTPGSGLLDTTSNKRPKAN